MVWRCGVVERLKLRRARLRRQLIKSQRNPYKPKPGPDNR
jgi:hypothetical protein